MVANPQGLHLRPASMIVKLATQYQSKIEFVKDNSRVDGKSILDILTLGSAAGNEPGHRGRRSRRGTALEALAELFASNFGEIERGTNPGFLTARSRPVVRPGSRQHRG